MKNLAREGLLSTAAALCLMLLVSVGMRADNEAGEYVRVSEEEGACKVQTAVRDFVSGDITVTLFGMSHSGLRDYYVEVERRLLTHDAVLLEGIKSDGIPELEVMKENGKVMAAIMGIETQHILNTEHEGWKNADMDPAEYKKALGTLGFSILPPKADKQLEMMRVVLGNPKALEAFRPQMCQNYLEFVRSKERKMFGHLDEKQYEVAKRLVFDARNAQAIKALKAEMAAGKRRIALVFGADHMPDLEKTITQSLGFKGQGEAQWLTSLVVQAPKEGKPALRKGPATR